MAAAIAKGVLLEQRVQQQLPQQSQQGTEAEQPGSSSALGNGPGGAAAPMAAGGEPSWDARWLAVRFETSLQNFEARLNAQVTQLAARLSALEARLPAGPQP